MAEAEPCAPTRNRYGGEGVRLLFSEPRHHHRFSPLRGSDRRRPVPWFAHDDDDVDVTCSLVRRRAVRVDACGADAARSGTAGLTAATRPSEQELRDEMKRVMNCDSRDAHRRPGVLLA